MKRRGKCLYISRINFLFKEVEMAFELPALPYALNALEPYISQRTMEFHYGKHHKAYVDNLNRLIAGTPYENMFLEEIVRATVDKPEAAAIFNNAAQAWNHDFFWKSMRPNGGGEPEAALKERIERDFGSVENFKQEFKNAAVSQFGSGWAWLADDNGTLKVVKTSNADTPLAHGLTPLLTLDVWEHAYYLDYQNLRPSFADAYLEHLINW